MLAWLSIRGGTQLRSTAGKGSVRCFAISSGSHLEETHHGRPPLTRGQVLHSLETNAVHEHVVGQGDLDRSKGRRLFREILRECTYLPDSFAREWTSKHVRSRFESYAFKTWKQRQLKLKLLAKQTVPEFKASSGQHETPDIWKLRLQAKRKEARQALATLRRANEGERKALLKVLYMAYGRTGKRRHELMLPLLPSSKRHEVETLLRQDAEMDQTDSEIETGANGLAEKDVTESDIMPDLAVQQTLTGWPTPQLRAVLQSQMKVQPATTRRSSPRRLSPVIPELNSWLRPLPQVRIKNLRKRHYSDLLDRLQVPLPTRDWTRLQDLACGRVKADPILPRRKLATTVLQENDVTKPLASALEMVIAHGKAPTRAFASREAHAMTPRFMQRVYAQVFSQCCLLKWDTERKQWCVTWGTNALHTNPRGDGARETDTT